MDPWSSTGLGVIVFPLTRELVWRGYQLKWENERFPYIAEVVKWATMLTAIPNRTGKEFSEAAGGNIQFQGTLLNFETLKHMTLQIMETYKAQQDILGNFKKALWDLEHWQRDHPQPKAPTYFGHRLAWPDRKTSVPTSTSLSEQEQTVIAGEKSSPSHDKSGQLPSGSRGPLGNAS